MKREIKTWYLLQVTLLLLCAWSFTACSDDGDSTTGRQVYKYLFAAEERDSTPVADRAQFAPYGWRNENPATEAMPQNFRTCQGPFVERDAKTGYDATYVPSRQGLDNLNISASSDFSEAGFTGLIAEIRKITSLPFTIVDLRSESHGLINGTHVSLYGRQSWANIGLSTAEIIEKEHQQMHATLGTSIELFDISSSNDYVPVNPQTIFVERVQTEAELCKANGIDYVRFTALDHAFPSTAIVEDFVRFVQSLPANTWLYFHCKAGKGRTTTFMVFYDMMRNPRCGAERHCLSSDKHRGRVSYLYG